TPSRRALSFPPPANPAIYPLSLHDALPISPWPDAPAWRIGTPDLVVKAPVHDLPAAGDVPYQYAVLPTVFQKRHLGRGRRDQPRDRKSTRLNSSHRTISYAVFCLKKKNNHHSRRFVSILKSQAPYHNDSN